MCQQIALVLTFDEVRQTVLYWYNNTKFNVLAYSRKWCI